MTADFNGFQNGNQTISTDNSKKKKKKVNFFGTDIVQKKCLQVQLFFNSLNFSFCLFFYYLSRIIKSVVIIPPANQNLNCSCNGPCTSVESVYLFTEQFQQKGNQKEINSHLKHLPVHLLPRANS